MKKYYQTIYIDKNTGYKIGVDLKKDFNFLQTTFNKEFERVQYENGILEIDWQIYIRYPLRKYGTKKILNATCERI